MPATSPFEPPPDDDLVHVRRAQAGDLDAFDELVRRHQSVITAMLHRFASNRADLEDMVQETFVRAWRSLGGWKPDKPFVHWLKRIAANMGLEFCRKHQRTPFARLVERDDEHDPLENLPHTPAQRDLGEAQFILSHLPPDDRALLTLLHLEEMPLAEIATHFGWSRVKAKVKAFRARQRLKSLLHQHGYTLT